MQQHSQRHWPTWAAVFLLISGATLAGGDGVIFEDNFEQLPPMMLISDASVDEGDSGEVDLVFPVTLSRPTALAVTVDYVSQAGSAQGGSDFLNTSGTLQFAPGMTTSEIRVGVLGDICVEDDETLTVDLSNLSPSARLESSSATGNIANDDPLPLLTLIPPPSSAEGDEGVSDSVFALALDRASCTAIQVDYATQDGSAEGGSDYQPISGSLTLPAFEVILDLPVSVTGDICVETDENYFVSLTNLTPNAAFGIDRAQTVISNDDPLPVLDIAPVAVNEGDTGQTALSFGLTLDRASCTDTQVDYATSDLTATESDGDYEGQNTSLVIPAFAETGAILIQGLGDTNVEGNETFQVDLLAAAPSVVRGIATATGTLVNDDFFDGPAVFRLNDTGVVQCSSDAADELACSSLTEGTLDYPSQDAEVGRDQLSPNPSNGAAGFELTKLDMNGVPLANQGADYSDTAWDCVRDEYSGLVWEVKAADGGLADAAWTYSWFNGTGFFDGGFAGVADSGVCSQAGTCDTGAYIAAVNATGRCGFDNWRLPTLTELLSIVHYGADQSPLIDLNYFPNTTGPTYWTADPALPASVIRVVDFDTGVTRANPQRDALNVRLVRGAEQ